ncbi:hypothetical protein Tco_0602553 [Tanacetum coccineum]
MHKLDIYSITRVLFILPRYGTNALSKFSPDTELVLHPLQDKLTLGDKSLDLSAFKLSRLFFSLLSSGSSSCWRSYGAQDKEAETEVAKESEDMTLSIMKDDKGKGNVHYIQNKLEKLEVYFFRAIKAKQVDDLDTLDVENRIKKLEEDFGRLLKTKKAKEAKKSKKAKEAKLAKEAKMAKEAKKA